MRKKGISKRERAVRVLAGQVAGWRRDNCERAVRVTALDGCVVCRVVSVKPSAKMRHAAEDVVHNGWYGDGEGKAARGPRGR